MKCGQLTKMKCSPVTGPTIQRRSENLILLSCRDARKVLTGKERAAIATRASNAAAKARSAKARQGGVSPCMSEGSLIPNGPRRSTECNGTANSLFTSVVGGFGLQGEFFIKTSCQSVQPSFQPEPATFEGKSRELLHGMLESLQNIRCLDLQRLGNRGDNPILYKLHVSGCLLQLIPEGFDPARRQVLENLIRNTLELAARNPYGVAGHTAQ